MPKRFTDTEKWKKRWIRHLSPKYKLFWVYILDACNHAGIWDVDIEMVNLILGEEFSENGLLAIFNGRIISIDDGNKWFIPRFIDFQYGDLNPENRAHKSVLDILEKEGARKGLHKGHYGVAKGRKDMDKVKDKELVKDKDSTRFLPPTSEEVSHYCIERNNQVDPHYFVDFYESKGWMVGKNKMKDWKSAVRNAERWEKKGVSNDKKHPEIYRE